MSGRTTFLYLIGIGGLLIGAIMVHSAYVMPTAGYAGDVVSFDLMFAKLLAVIRAGLILMGASIALAAAVICNTIEEKPPAPTSPSP